MTKETSFRPKLARRIKQKVVKVAPTEVLHVILPKSVAPVVIQDANVVKVVPVPKKKKSGWLEYIFGTEKHGDE